MKKPPKKTPNKTSDFLGTFHPKIKRIKTEPRQRIRHLLRSSIPLGQVNILRKTDSESMT
ncbi:hypothetical protein HDE68_004269 [Pedobacter cryoconitis]|uniref:Uncharacterized protein n=1 Tax=Pedobacter cryoconitis TaxID=188932 RepID=A0A7W8ZQV9_9SPHI|nr:hypothetical protein [Pedobacter cryoconitis]